MQEPHLTEQQQIELFQAVGRRVAAIVTRTSGRTIPQQLPTMATVPVLGAFVSLKRFGQLRSCMGCMSDQMPLGEAVEAAALRAAKDDPRFPPIAAAELPELDMEVWLLWGMQRVAARGHDRIKAVEVGRHGVQISMSGNRGLLLPGVAIEHEMDALTFLEAVCRKAGLPQDAWYSDHALLHTFEGHAVRGPFNAVELDNKKTADELSMAIRFQRLGPREPGPAVPEFASYKTEFFGPGRMGVSPSNGSPEVAQRSASSVNVVSEVSSLLR
jgi:AmmeMemoRadiSam system protein A